MNVGSRGLVLEHHRGRSGFVGELQRDVLPVAVGMSPAEFSR